jgi:sRNA-binding regulator protein Hfq
MNTNISIDEERQRQINEGRMRRKEANEDADHVVRSSKLSISRPRSTQSQECRQDGRRPSKPRQQQAPAPAKGHDAYLETLIAESANAEFTLNDGSSVTGVVIDKDKYTITIKRSESPLVLYKHSISYFQKQ